MQSIMKPASTPAMVHCWRRVGRSAGGGAASVESIDATIPPAGSASGQLQEQRLVAVDVDRLERRRLPREDPNFAPRQAKRGGQDLDHRLVRLSALGRRGDVDLQAVADPADDSIAGGFGDDFEVEAQAD